MAPTEPDLPQLSVIMACHNAEMYVGEAIESLLGQTYTDFRVIIVDDASSDSSAQIIRYHAQHDGRVQPVFLNENVGPATARNRAIHLAQGEWLAILDADDVALPDRLAKQMAYVASHPSTVLLGTGFVEINGTGEALRTYRYPARTQKYRRQITKTGRFAPHSSCLYHKATVEHLGGFNCRFHRSQDADLWFRLSLAGEIAALPEPLVKIRKHSDSISNDESGRVQALFGLAARTCHFLRVTGASDPSAQSDEEWGRFIEWLQIRAEGEQLFQRKQDRSRLRNQYFSSRNRVVGVWHLVGGCCSLSKIHYMIRRRRFMTDLAARFAREWPAVDTAVLGVVPK